MTIDFHAHIFPPALTESGRQRLLSDKTFATLYASPKAPIASVEPLLEAMDSAQVSMAVAVNIGWTTQELCEETNTYLLDAARRHPQRIVAFCSVNPLAGQAAVREVQRCARLGARGIGELHPDFQGFDLGDREVMAPVMQAAKELGMVVLSHASEPVGHQYAGKGKTTPDVTYRFVTNFPDVPIVLAHWGGGLPFYALMPEVADVLQHVYFDTAASPFLYKREVFKLVTELVGADRILFGSDYPLMKPERLIQQLMDSGLPKWSREKILEKNARRLLQL